MTERTSTRGDKYTALCAQLGIAGLAVYTLFNTVTLQVKPHEPAPYALQTTSNKVDTGTFDPVVYRIRDSARAEIHKASYSRTEKKEGSQELMETGVSAKKYQKG